MQEIWKPVVGYESDYAVSNAGNIKRTTRWKSGRADRPATFDRPIRAVPVSGYHYVTLCVNAKPRRRAIHQIVADAFIGACPPGKEINHKNGLKADNRAENLEYVTRAENLAHARLNLPRKHTSLRGEMVPNARLNERKVREIKRRLMDGESQKRIADDFGVVRQVVWGIAKGKSWAWVQ